MEIRTDPPCATCGQRIDQHELRAGVMLGCFIAGCTCVDFEQPAATWHLGRWDGASDAVEVADIVVMSVLAARGLVTRLDQTGELARAGTHDNSDRDREAAIADGLAQETARMPEALSAPTNGADEHSDYTRGWLAGRDLLWRPALLAVALRKVGHPAAETARATVTTALDRMEQQLRR